jgi:hypothetical protein
MEINMEDFTFRQYLKESGYDKMSYQEEVYTTCLGLGNYQNIDLYYQDEIDEAYEQNVPVNELAARLCAQFDTDYGKPKPEEIPEFEEDEYSQETLDAMADYPQDSFDESAENIVETSLRDLPTCKFAIRITPYKGNSVIKYATAPAHTSSIQKLKEMMENRLNMDLVEEVVVYPVDNVDLSDEPVSDLAESTEATETEETFDDWKGYVFKYLDKRVDVNKIKELGTYIKDFVKQEWDNGEPSWFAAAESIVNYARANYPNALKDRSYATTITESLDGPATFTDALVNQFVRYIKKWFTSNTKYRVLMSDNITSDGEHPYTHEKKKTYKLTLRNTPVPTYLYLVVYADYCYIAAEGERFTTKSYKFTSVQSLDKALTELNENINSIYEDNLDEAFIQDDRGNVSVTDLVDKIMEKAGMVVDYDDDYTAAAYYIADFYSKQSMPVNGMVMWGARDLKKFKSIYDEQIQNANTSEEIQEYEKKAVTGVRSIMLGNPGKKWTWIEEIKDEARNERKAAEEKRRQDYLNSDEYKKSQDPGWRGPRGTWTLGT